MWIRTHREIVELMTIEEYTKKLNNTRNHELTWYSVLSCIENIGPLCEIAFDSLHRYKKHDAGPTFFIRNGYSEDSEWVPFSVSSPPKPLLEFNQKISTGDYVAVCRLVSHNLDAIMEHADKSTGTCDLFEAFKSGKQDLITELTNLPPKKTGLMNGVWLDGGGTYKNGGHWMRIKVLKEKGEGFATYTIPEHKWLHDDGLDSWEKHMVEKYVEYNEDDLVKLFKKELTMDDYLNRMVYVNPDGEPVNPQVKNEWQLYSDAGFGYQIVISTFNGKFNYRDKHGKMILDKPVESCDPIRSIAGGLICHTYDDDVIYTYRVGRNGFTLIDKLETK